MRVPLPQRGLRLVGLAALLGATFGPAISHALPAHGSGFVPMNGPAGPLQPPSAALNANGALGDGSRQMGLVPDTHGLRVSHLAQRVTVNTAALPATVDLSQYNPSVGDQGQVGSCAAWATGYYLRGWYALRDGYYPPAANGRGAGFSPMFLYSRSSYGVDQGSSIEVNLAIMEQGATGASWYGQGDDTRSDYSQGDYNFTTLPTAGEIANATQYKIRSYTSYGGASTGLNLQDWIKTTIAGGNPVVLGIPVFHNFYNATSTSYLVGAPAAGDSLVGYHAIFGDKYDANGVWIENQWGTWWGLNGWVELSWAFINYLYTGSSYWYDAVSMTPLPLSGPGATATGTPTRTATATPQFTSTRTSTPTSTNTPNPAATQTFTATRTATATPNIVASPTRTFTKTPIPTSTPRRRR